MKKLNKESLKFKNAIPFFALLLLLSIVSNVFTKDNKIDSHLNINNMFKKSNNSITLYLTGDFNKKLSTTPEVVFLC